MYINYKKKDGIEYAMIVTSVRNGKKVSKNQTVYLGRVLDKKRGIFKSRERGIMRNLSLHIRGSMNHVPPW